MSAEYSVEEVRNVALFLDGMSRRMLNDYAERIEADEKTKGRIDFKGMWNAISDQSASRPPAQDAQVDDLSAQEDARAYPNVYWVEAINRTYGGKTGEAIKGQVSTLIYQRHGLNGELMTEVGLRSIRAAAEPDAADSGRVGDEVRGLLAYVYGMGASHGHHYTVEGGYTAYTHNEWRDAYREAIDTAIEEDAETFAALAAQGQGDGMCNPDNPERRCVCREEFGYRVCKSAPPASPAGVPDALSDGAVIFGDEDDDGYRMGWNACRASMLAATSAPEGGEVDRDN